MAEAQVADKTETQQTETKEITLDDVYRDAGVDKIVSADTTQQTQRQETQQVTQQQTQKVEPSSIPDAYDAENFKAYLTREAAGKSELTQAVRAITSHLNAQQQERAVAATKADVEKAVGTLNEIVGHPKPKVIEAWLDGRVREDPRLKAVWENRGKNPVAWNNAQRILAKEASEDFSMKVDPNLVAAQRARKESQRQMATTTQDTAGSAVEERLASATGADFESQWERLKGGN